MLDLRGTKITDEGLAHLKTMTTENGYRFKKLYLSDTKITDSGLEAIKDITSLQELYLANTEISSLGLDHLAKMTNLTQLNLENCKVGVSGLENLKGMIRMDTLNLMGTRCNDDCIAFFKGMFKLRQLNLGDTSVGDSGFDDLKNLSRLESLDMRGTAITDKGFTNLKKLFALRELYLNGTKVTDKGLMQLTELPKLTDLHLNISLVTKAGVLKFRRCGRSARFATEIADMTRDLAEPLPFMTWIRRSLTMRIALFACAIMMLGVAAVRADVTGPAPFGKTAEGDMVESFTLQNKNGVRVKLITLGATITELHVPDKSGKLADVVLGFDDVAGYQSAANQHFGCTTGRVANRIAQGQVHARRQGVPAGRQQRRQSPARRHQAATSPRCLEGRAAEARQGARRSASATPAPTARRAIPASSTITVTYTLTDKNELRIDYTATHRQGDAGQPDQPQLLQPGRGGHGDGPRSRADARRRPSTRRRTRR